MYPDDCAMFFNIVVYKTDAESGFPVHKTEKMVCVANVTYVVADANLTGIVSATWL